MKGKIYMSYEKINMDEVIKRINELAKKVKQKD